LLNKSIFKGKKMLIKKVDFTPIEILLETADDYDAIVNILSYVAHAHPSEYMIRAASNMLEKIETIRGANHA